MLFRGNWLVLRNSPNKQNAFKLLAYISRAKAQAAFAKAIPCGPVNNDGFKLLPKDLAERLPGAPEFAKSEVLANYKRWAEKRPNGRTNCDAALKRCVALLAQ
ncbi:spermidine/putrescine-binding protein [Bradyrhizobium sp. i1.4.4]